MNYEISEFNSEITNAPLFLKQGVADRRCLSWLITHWHGAKLREAYLWVAVHPLLPTPTRLWGSPVFIQVQGCAMLSPTVEALGSVTYYTMFPIPANRKLPIQTSGSCIGSFVWLLLRARPHLRAEAGYRIDLPGLGNYRITRWLPF